ncbi:MAG: Holliday junction resolvase RuvX [Anaerolineae bacterium]|nr:Holliday junction resolvase RuvX [Anaerolineae bacterium]NIN98322.1 Holliday junction resolvase RuvX [Anaerolineae bacterium]
MRLMALDIGDRRIGVAVSDPSKTLATSLQVVRRRSDEADVSAIASLVEEYDVEKIIVGHPLQMDGTAGEQARRVEAYAERLREAVRVPIILRDEGFSTVRAREMMIEAGTKQKDRRTRIDAVAAAVILQDYLDSLREEKARVPWEETTR